MFLSAGATVDSGMERITKRRNIDSGAANRGALHLFRQLLCESRDANSLHIVYISTTSCSVSQPAGAVGGTSRLNNTHSCWSRQSNGGKEPNVYILWGDFQNKSPESARRQRGSACLTRRDLKAQCVRFHLVVKEESVTALTINYTLIFPSWFYV